MYKLYTPIQYFEMEMQLKRDTISGMPLKINNTASTLWKPTKNVHVYEVILYLSIITAKAFV
jgi:hypothetical protein